MINRLPAHLQSKPRLPSRLWLASTLGVLVAGCGPGDPASAVHDTAPAAQAPGGPIDGTPLFDHSMIVRNGVEPVASVPGESVAAYEVTR
jgi:hypothetical protein